PPFPHHPLLPLRLSPPWDCACNRCGNRPPFRAHNQQTPVTESDALLHAVQAVRRQADAVAAVLSQSLSLWWPQRVGLFVLLEEPLTGLGELARHAHALLLPASALQQLTDALDLAAVVAVVAAKETEAASALRGCSNWEEATELVRFITRCARWLRCAGALAR